MKIPYQEIVYFSEIANCLSKSILNFLGNENPYFLAIIRANQIKDRILHVACDLIQANNT